MNRPKKVLNILNELAVFYTDLNRLITEYEGLPFFGTQVQQVKILGSLKLATDEKYLYVGTTSLGVVERYDLNTLQLVNTFPLGKPRDIYGIDIYENELYISDGGSLSVLSIPTTLLVRQWQTHVAYTIKIHNGNVYCGTNRNIQIYNLIGNLVKQIGKDGSGNAEFNGIWGIEMNNKFIYITDRDNHRIQVLNLENCTYSYQWGGQGSKNGKFSYPSEIRIYQDVCYVGDNTSIQGFTKDGKFLCRFGKTLPGNGSNEFYNIKGMIIIRNRMYVSEHGNNRVVVLE